MLKKVYGYINSVWPELVFFYSFATRICSSRLWITRCRWIEGHPYAYCLGHGHGQELTSQGDCLGHCDGVQLESIVSAGKNKTKIYNSRNNIFCTRDRMAGRKASNVKPNTKRRCRIVISYLLQKFCWSSIYD